MRKNFQTDLHEIFGEGWQWANEQMMKFLVAIRIRDLDADADPDSIRIQIQIRIMTMVSALPEVWAVLL